MTSFYRLRISLLLLAFLAATVALPPRAHPQDGGAPTAYRHHVIFLLDQSGTTLGYPRVIAGRVAELEAVLREELEPLLRDTLRNGFGVPLYDPQRDLSSALAFGLFGHDPWFDPAAGTGNQGFFRVLWVEEPSLRPAELAGRIPRESTDFTGLTAARQLAIPTLRVEAQRRGGPTPAYERTFVVMITDGRGNSSIDFTDEMTSVGQGALKYGISAEATSRDRAAAIEAVNALGRHYRFETGTDRGNGIRVGRRLKVDIRELIAQQWSPADSLLAERPPANVEVSRGAGGRYTAHLAIRPRHGGAYELLDVWFRAPDADTFSVLPRPAEGTPATADVPLSRSGIRSAKAEFRLSFARRDSVYGRAVQHLVVPVRFHPAPGRWIPDWLILPGLTEDQSADLATGVLALLGAGLLWMLLFPAARARVELVGVRGTSADDPLVVDFTRERMSSDRGAPSLLGTLRLVNAARRGPFPRAERRFDLRVEVELDLPVALEATPPVVGLSDRMECVQLFHQASHNSQQGVLLRPGAMRDYAGDASAPVPCTLTVRAAQLRTGWLRRGARTAGVLKQPLFIRFVPEAAEVQAELQGTAAPTAPGRLPRVTVEHRRGPRPVLSPLLLAIRSTSTRVCSRPLDVRIEATLYPLDRAAGPIPGAAVLGEQELADEPGPQVEWVRGADGRPYARIRGLRGRRDGDWGVRIPLWVDFDLLPLPPVTGDEYVVEVTLHADDDALWPTETVRHGIRVQADSRRPELLFQVSASPGAEEPEWRTLDRESDGAELVLKVVQPLRWNEGSRESTVDFVALRIDNVARSGPGRVSIALLPDGSVAPAPGAEMALEPGYERGGCADILSLRDADPSVGTGAITRELRWEVPSHAPPGNRPVELFLSFRESGMKSFDPRIRRFPYRCRLPFRCTVEGGPAPADRFDVTLQVEFVVERYAGEHVLAIDFGTSAVVAAFAGSMDVAAADRGGRRPALLDLQRQYTRLLREWDDNGDLRQYSAEETRFPNREGMNPFIPSQLVWRSGKKLGEPEFVAVPATSARVMQEPGRAIFYLKGLILEGSPRLPRIQHYTEETLWIDRHGTAQRGEQPLVDGVIRSAYRGLMRYYVERILEEQVRYVDKLVFTHPNNFHLHHLDRVRDILRDSFGERFDLHLLSESNAVALYCAYPPDRFDRDALRGSRRRRFLVYDIGAGTLDVTYTALQWADESDGNRLREMEVLFKSGVPSGGNRLDMALAKVLDARLRLLEAQCRERGVVFKYLRRIVDPEEADTADYPQRMLPVKLALMQLKEDASALASRGTPFTAHVPVDCSSDLQYQIVDVYELYSERVREELQGLGVEVRDPVAGSRPSILVPLTSEEIFAHPTVAEWVRSVTDEPIADLAHALMLRGLEPRIDCLVLSGRTSQFPPVRERLLAALETHLKIPRDRLNEAVLTPAERKSAVGLGALYYGLIHRHVAFVDRSIWASYGLVYETAAGRRFREFFSHATLPDPAKGDRVVLQHGLSSLRLSRTHEIPRSGAVWVVVTYSRDPDRDLRDDPEALDNGRFMVIRALGADVLGTSLKVRITLRINDEDQLAIAVDADGRHIEINPKDVPVNVPTQPQSSWPFTGLKEPVAMPPAGKVPVPSLAALPLRAPAHAPDPGAPVATGSD